MIDDYCRFADYCFENRAIKLNVSQFGLRGDGVDLNAGHETWLNFGCFIAGVDKVQQNTK